MAARAPRPEDLYDLRVPTDIALSPDGRFVAFSVKSVAPGKDGYRTSLWLAPSDGSAPARQLTVGSKNDASPRWSPDSRQIAFLSDRGSVLQAGGGGAKPGKAEAPKEGGNQVWLLPSAMAGRRASSLTCRRTSRGSRGRPTADASRSSAPPTRSSRQPSQSGSPRIRPHPTRA